MIQLDWNVLDRYFSGEASADEAAAVARLTAHPDGAMMLQSVRELWDAAGVVASPSRDVNAAWHAMSERMTQDVLRTDRTDLAGPARPVLPFRRTSGPSRRPWPMSRMWPTMLAACAVVAVGAVALDRVIDSRAATNRAVMAAPADREFATRRSQRADIYLSDGTRVVLNVDTRLRVPATFGAAAREVWLEGEAYFKVAADSMRPFRVRTAAGIAEDVSTAFIVRHYPESDAMHVGVAEGVVLVRRDSASPLTAMLERGDLARLDGAGRVSVQHGVNMEQEMAWTSGTLVFDRVPLREVVPRLARWFDADIRLHDDALGDVRYTASFRSERVEKVLELLAASLDARVDRHAENAFVISARRPGR